MTGLVTTNPDNVVAVVDTNVLMEFASISDLEAAHQKNRADSAGLGSADVLYRKQRARDTLMLAIHLDELRARTYSLHSEPATILERLAPPRDSTAKTVFTTIVLYCVKDYVLPNWEWLAPKEADGRAGNDADHALLDYARRNGLPLVTNEGHTPQGLVDEKLRKAAKDAGVAVYSPGEYVAGKFADERQVAQDFIQRFRAGGHQYLRDNHVKPGAPAHENLSRVSGFYRWLLDVPADE